MEMFVIFTASRQKYLEGDAWKRKGSTMKGQAPFIMLKFEIRHDDEVHLSHQRKESRGKN